MRQRVWEAANVRLRAVVLDTDTTVYTLFGDQMGARKGYKRKQKGKQELATDPDISGRDQGKRGEGTAQRRPTDGPTDRGAFADGVGLRADDGEDAAGAR